MDRLEVLIKCTFYHPKIHDACHSIISNCPISPMVCTTYKPYGHLAPQNAPIIPWSEVHDDCIGPWKVSLPDNNTIQFYALMCIDPVTNLIEILRFHGPPTTEKMKQLFENHWLARYPCPEKIVHDNGPKFLGHNFQFPLNYAGIKPTNISAHTPTSNRSLRLPTKSLDKFSELYSSSITQLTQHKVIAFSMRPSLQLCKLFIAPLTPHLAITHLACWYSNVTCFLTYLSLQISLRSLNNDRHRLTPDSLRLAHAGLSTTTPSATKFITAILTTTSWKPFALVPMRSFVSIPTIPLPCNAVRPMNAFPFVILLRFARLKIPWCEYACLPSVYLRVPLALNIPSS